MMALNGLFVRVWARPELYLGRPFDVLLGGYILVQTFNHCLAHPFVLAKETRQLAIICLIEAPLNLLGTVWAVRHFGPRGLLAASIGATFVTSFFWIWRNGPRKIGLVSSEVMTACKSLLPLFMLTLLGSTLAFLPAGAWWCEALLCTATAAILYSSSRRELVFVLQRLRLRSRP
jgi:hypothetical protein